MYTLEGPPVVLASLDLDVWSPGLPFASSTGVRFTERTCTEREAPRPRSEPPARGGFPRTEIRCTPGTPANDALVGPLRAATRQCYPGATTATAATTVHPTWDDVGVQLATAMQDVDHIEIQLIRMHKLRARSHAVGCENVGLQPCDPVESAFDGWDHEEEAVAYGYFANGGGASLSPPQHSTQRLVVMSGPPHATEVARAMGSGNFATAARLSRADVSETLDSPRDVRFIALSNLATVLRAADAPREQQVAAVQPLLDDETPSRIGDASLSASVSLARSLAAGATTVGSPCAGAVAPAPPHVTVFDATRTPSRTAVSTAPSELAVLYERPFESWSPTWPPFQSPIGIVELDCREIGNTTRNVNLATRIECSAGIPANDPVAAPYVAFARTCLHAVTTRPVTARARSWEDLDAQLWNLAERSGGASIHVVVMRRHRRVRGANGTGTAEVSDVRAVVPVNERRFQVGPPTRTTTPLVIVDGLSHSRDIADLLRGNDRDMTRMLRARELANEDLRNSMDLPRLLRLAAVSNVVTVMSQLDDSNVTSYARWPLSEMPREAELARNPRLVASFRALASVTASESAAYDPCRQSP